MSEGPPADIIVGVDTHKHTHAAVAITGLGARVAEPAIKVGWQGYRQLETWAASLETAFGIEGAGSYGTDLARAPRWRPHCPRGQPSQPPAATPARQDRSP